MKHIPASQAPFVPASHEDARQPGVLKRVIATHDDIPAGQVMMVNWARLPGGSSFRRHYHEDMQEVFVLISGLVSMTVDETAVEMTAGDTVIVDPHEIHEMKNLRQTAAEYIVFGVSTGRGGQTVVVN
ncbi:MAG: cupin domain-containing protein [Planctomycetaceae bacterium]|jgi:mannose-6-phosphate isomerase-like protein (cupin superfamily)